MTELKIINQLLILGPQRDKLKKPHKILTEIFKRSQKNFMPYYDI